MATTIIQTLAAETAERLAVVSPSAAAAVAGTGLSLLAILESLLLDLLPLLLGCVLAATKQPAGDPRAAETATVIVNNPYRGDPKGFRVRRLTRLVERAGVPAEAVGPVVEAMLDTGHSVTVQQVDEYLATK